LLLYQLPVTKKEVDPKYHMWKNRVAPPSPQTKTIHVQGHNHRSSQVHSHICKINTKAHVNKKETKATKSKKKTGKPKHSAFHNGQDECKESVQLAKALHIQELRNLMNININMCSTLKQLIH
jgi:hypothetical protein